MISQEDFLQLFTDILVMETIVIVLFGINDGILLGKSLYLTLYSDIVHDLISSYVCMYMI